MSDPEYDESQYAELELDDADDDDHRDEWMVVRALDGTGRAKVVDPEAFMRGELQAPLFWVHLNRNYPAVHRWLHDKSGLSDVAIQGLVAEESRPRCLSHEGGVLLNLRGVNLNPGADPSDMVSIRMWIDDHQIVTVRRRDLRAVADVVDNLDIGIGPHNASEFLVMITDRIVERMSQAITDLNDQVDQLEEDLLSEEPDDLRASLRDLRRESVALRRYIGPQRDAMAAVTGEPLEWLSPVDRQLLRGVADRLIRYLEDLDIAREKATFVQDEISSNLNEQMNKNMYVISVLAGIFLPITFVTGLLGINVAGIPGSDWSWSFAVVTIVLAAIGALELYLLRKLHWF
jgi:zinc transporter